MDCNLERMERSANGELELWLLLWSLLSSCGEYLSWNATYLHVVFCSNLAQHERVHLLFQWEALILCPCIPKMNTNCYIRLSWGGPCFSLVLMKDYSIVTNKVREKTRVILCGSWNSCYHCSCFIISQEVPFAFSFLLTYLENRNVFDSDHQIQRPTQTVPHVQPQHFENNHLNLVRTVEVHS